MTVLTQNLGMSMDVVLQTLENGFKAQYVLMHANKRLVFKLAHHFGFDKSVPFEDYVMVSSRETISIGRIF